MKKISLSRLQNVEYHAFMLDVVTLITQSQIPSLQTTATQMQTLLTSLASSIAYIRKSEFTQQLAQLDKTRDQYLYGLNFRIKSESYSPNETVRQAADKIKIVLDHYKNLTVEHFRKESDLIEHLLKELSGEQYQTAIQQTGIQDWLNAIKTANQQFIDVYLSRRDESANQTPIDVKQIRKQLDEHYRQLIKLVEALSVLQPSDSLTQLQQKLETTQNQWLTTLATRKTDNKDNSHAPIMS